MQDAACRRSTCDPIDDVRRSAAMPRLMLASEPWCAPVRIHNPLRTSIHGRASVESREREIALPFVEASVRPFQRMHPWKVYATRLPACMHGRTRMTASGLVLRMTGLLDALPIAVLRASLTHSPSLDEYICCSKKMWFVTDPLNLTL